VSLEGRIKELDAKMAADVVRTLGLRCEMAAATSAAAETPIMLPSPEEVGGLDFANILQAIGDEP
jgi:hypothetical protein